MLNGVALELSIRYVALYRGCFCVVVDAQPFPHDKCNLFARADETNVNELMRNGKTRAHQTS